MRSPSYVLLCMLVMVANLGLLVPAPAIGQTAPERWTLPRTPDGHPDLQGVWANNNATPLERPEAWAGKERLTEEELANLVAAAAEATDPGQDAIFGDQLVLAAIAREQATSYDPTTGNYNQFWIVERTFTDRTSLVVDPLEGRIPPLTDTAQAAQTRAGGVSTGAPGRLVGGPAVARAVRHVRRAEPRGPVTTATITSSRARITL